MKSMLVLILAATLVMAAAACAEPPGINYQEGQWEITTMVDIPGMPKGNEPSARLQDLPEPEQSGSPCGREGTQGLQNGQSVDQRQHRDLEDGVQGRNDE